MIRSKLTTGLAIALTAGGLSILPACESEQNTTDTSTGMQNEAGTTSNQRVEQTPTTGAARTTPNTQTDNTTSDNSRDMNGNDANRPSPEGNTTGNTGGGM